MVKVVTILVILLLGLVAVSFGCVRKESVQSTQPELKSAQPPSIEEGITETNKVLEDQHDIEQIDEGLNVDF
ncbi:hypothetical protein J4430_00920 [Candidatus Woesearchaeota archaeon]|nr:hypothetical protein [Candidatus Woesearchaeota archaeon]